LPAIAHLGQDVRLMLSRPRALGPLVIFLCAIVLVPARAHAQWFLSGGVGGNATHTAAIHIDKPGEGTSLVFHDVAFKARPFDSPIYYDWRVGRTIGSSGHFSVEFEFTHLKVIAHVEREVRVTGTLGGESIDQTMRIDAIVQGYAMTHGLNFLLVNLGWRRPIGGPLSLVLRAGAGETLPHAETTVEDLHREQYEFAGPAAHLAAGVALRLFGPLSATADYRITAARPRITIVNGSGQMTAVTSQVAVAFALGLPK
jgi:hypothetical protein